MAFLTRINGHREKEVKQSGYEVQMLPCSLGVFSMSLGRLSFQQKNGPKLTLFIDKGLLKLALCVFHVNIFEKLLLTY